MIDWLSVCFNFIWILGLAILLATVSLDHWLAGQRQQAWGQTLTGPAVRLALAAGFGLFGLGLSLTVEPWWLKIGWLGVLGLAVWEGISAWRARRDAGRLERS